ncbi:MAG: hypothetical protein ABR887_04175 [Methanoregulaceae archaeon]
MMRTGFLSIVILLCLTIIVTSGCISPSHQDTSSTGDSGAGLKSVITYPTIASGSPITCPGNQPAFITDKNVYQTPEIAEPAPRVPFRDPVFGTCIVRVTDRTKDISPDDNSKGLKNEYSRIESFNADGSRIIVRGTAATWYLYDAQTLEKIAKIPIGMDPRWDPFNPNLIYYIAGPVLISYNTLTQEQKVIHDFTTDFPNDKLTFVWTRYEGGPSRDGRYWGLMVEDETYHTIAILTYDQQIDKIIARRDLKGVPNADADSVIISPLGTYVVAQNDYCERGTLGTYDKPCGLMVYDRDLQHARGILRIIGHSDFAFDAEGREIMIYQDIDTDYISIVDLGTGKITPLEPIDFSHTAIGLHFSGLAFDRPGWALVSTHNGGHPTAYTWMDDDIFALELKPQGRIVRLAHTHSLVSSGVEHDYWAEPQANVNRDFTRVLFTTNWGRSGTDEVEMYMIELPKNWMEQLPK